MELACQIARSGWWEAHEIIALVSKGSRDVKLSDALAVAKQVMPYLNADDAPTIAAWNELREKIKVMMRERGETPLNE